MVLNDKIPVIIEDKTFTGEHDDQIKRYEEGLIECARQNEGYLEISGEKYLINQGNIIKVYWKTGFYYDADKYVDADIRINSDDILTLLEPYSQYSDILFDYVEKIKSDNNWYLVHGKYWDYDTDKDDSFWGLNVVRHSIAQHKLMRDIFPESGWVDDSKKTVVPWRVCNGSSYGRPWTEMRMWGNKFSNGDDFEVFWRIDADNGDKFVASAQKFYADFIDEAEKNLKNFE